MTENNNGFICKDSKCTQILSLIAGKSITNRDEIFSEYYICTNCGKVYAFLKSDFWVDKTQNYHDMQDYLFEVEEIPDDAVIIFHKEIKSYLDYIAKKIGKRKTIKNDFDPVTVSLDLYHMKQDEMK